MKDFPINNEDHKHKHNMKKLQGIPQTNLIFFYLHMVSKTISMSEDVRVVLH